MFFQRGRKYPFPGCETRRVDAPWGDYRTANVVIQCFPGIRISLSSLRPPPPPPPPPPRPLYPPPPCACTALSKHGLGVEPLF